MQIATRSREDWCDVGTEGTNSPGKNSLLEFFPLAKFAAKLLTARKIATYVAILGSHPAIHAAQGILPRLLSAGKVHGKHINALAGVPFASLGNVYLPSSCKQ